MVFFKQFVRMYVSYFLPRVVQRWVPFPLYQVLKLAVTSVMSVIDDCFDFVFFFAADQIWWRMCEIRPVSECLSVGQEEGGVEHVMNTP